jgi:hypothetical protein
MSRPLPAAGITLVDPHPGALVLPGQWVRPGTNQSDLPRFGDNSWQLAYLSVKDTATSVPLRWMTFPAEFRDTFKRLTWALINIATPDVILSRPWSTTRARLTASSLSHTVKAWKRFADWLLTQRITRLAEVSTGTLADYATALREAERTRNYAARQLLALTRLWAYSPYLLPEDRIPMPPWDEYGTDDYLVASHGTTGRNRRVPIHPATMSPLLVWALRFVTDFADDILTARDEHARLLANIPPEPGPDDKQILMAYFDRLQAIGHPIPSTGRLNPQGHRRAQIPGLAQTAIDVRYIAGTLGISIQTAHVVINKIRPRLRERPTSARAELNIAITGHLDRHPWVEGIGLDQVPSLVLHLSTACLVVVSYLSGMRPEEVLHLRHGCCTPANSSDNGIVRYHVTGLHFKGVTNEEGNTVSAGEVRDQPWIVIAPVAAAITVLERLTGPGGLLFPATISGAPKTGSPDSWRGDGLIPATAADRIERFIELTNNLAREHGREHEVVPPDPAGTIVLSRFRQTVGWFINRLPGGRVALGIQYGHLQLTMSEGYGKSRELHQTGEKPQVAC